MPRALPSADGFQRQGQTQHSGASKVAQGPGKKKEEGEEEVFLAGDRREGWRGSGMDGLPGGAGRAGGTRGLQQPAPGQAAGHSCGENSRGTCTGLPPAQAPAGDVSGAKKAPNPPHPDPKGNLVGVTSPRLLSASPTMGRAQTGVFHTPGEH